MLNVLFIQPQNHNKLGFQAFILPEPLGLETVAASLTSERDVHILDLHHAVLPTALGLNRFYKEFARLYMSTYLNFLSLRGIVNWFRYRRKKRGRRLRDSLKQLWALIRLIRGTSARALVGHHYKPPGKLYQNQIPNKREEAWPGFVNKRGQHRAAGLKPILEVTSRWQRGRVYLARYANIDVAL